MSAAPQPAPPVAHAPWRLWSNPIFRRYCQSRLRFAGLGVALLVTVLVAGFIVSLASSIGVNTGATAADAARGALIPLLVLQAFILFVLGTAQVSGGMTAERDEGVIDYQRLLPMTPLAKVLGYLFGLPVREYAMFLATLPFTGWALWRGQVAAPVWLQLYVVVCTSTLLYHCTGLLTGTVAKNRRWAFLASIGLVFLLYTVIPQMAKFGLVYFKYLTITPVFEELLPGLLPSKAAAAWRIGQWLMPTVKFFGLDFSEVFFTVFSQGGLILISTLMLCRRWRRAEAHLLGKGWAVGFFVWIQILLLGNALPLIETGALFPSLAFSNFVRLKPDWVPKGGEALLMSGSYGVVTLLLVLVLGGRVTPTRDTQLRGWRRARKQGASGLPWFSDAATGFWAVALMALAGALGWFVFTRAVVESRWFPGHEVPAQIGGYFAAVLLTVGLGFQTLSESRGARATGLAVIFLGVVPLMVGAVLGALGERFATAAAWIVGLSPISLPIYATGSLLSLAELPLPVARAVPRAFHFWLLADVSAVGWLTWHLWTSRRTMAAEVLRAPLAPPPLPGPDAARP